MQVLDLGTVQVEGTWIEGDRAIIANADFLSIFRPGIGFGHFTGYGEIRGDKDLSKLPLLLFDGPIEVSVLSAHLADRNF